MKLPFDFGIKFVFRMLIPGFFMALGFLPILNKLLDSYGNPIQLQYAFLISIILLGWLTVILDMPIYMLFEGRRFWPSFLSNLFTTLQKKRLERLEYRIRELDEIRDKTGKFTDTQLQLYREANFDRRKYPVGDDGKYMISSPTRLGNLMAAYENHPSRVYGMDAVFYWYRVWLTLDKDLREEIESQQAIPDSAVYTSFALLIDGLLLIIYVTLSLWPLVTLPSLPKTPELCLFCVLSFLLSYIVYRASIHVHAQFGETFKSIFDIQAQNPVRQPVLDEVAKLTNDPSLLTRSSKDQARVIWRYLQYYLIRCPICNKSFPAASIKEHITNLHKSLSKDPSPDGTSPAVKDSQTKI